MTGTLGAAGAAVRLLLAGGELPQALRPAFAHPAPRVREALWLRERAPLNALIDLSDGLAGDAGHLAAASGVAVVLDLDCLPLAPGTEMVASGREGRLGLALMAGEDFELCLVTPSGALEGVVDGFKERFGLALTRVGRILAGEGVWAEGGGVAPYRLDLEGFSHFTAAEVQAGERERRGEGGG